MKRIYLLLTAFLATTLMLMAETVSLDFSKGSAEAYYGMTVVDASGAMVETPFTLSDTGTPAVTLTGGWRLLSTDGVNADLRAYRLTSTNTESSVLTISVPDGYAITGVNFTTSNAAATWEASAGSLTNSGAEFSWTGTEGEVAFTYTHASKNYGIKTMDITFEATAGGEEPAEPDVPTPGEEVETEYSLDFSQNQYGMTLVSVASERNPDPCVLTDTGALTVTLTGATNLYNKNGGQLRLLAGSAISFSAPEGYVVTKVTFTGSAATGSLAVNGDVVDTTWEGSLATVTFNNVADALKNLTQIDVTLAANGGGEEPADPTPGDDIETQYDLDFAVNQYGMTLVSVASERNPDPCVLTDTGALTVTLTGATNLYNKNGGQLRLLAGSAISFSAPEGYVVTKVTFTGSAATGSLAVNGDVVDTTWEGKLTTATFNNVADALKNLTQVSITIEKGEPDVPAGPVEYESLAAWLAAMPAEAATVASPVTVAYQNGEYLYVAQDGVFALVKGMVDGTFANGDIIGSITAVYGLADGLPVMTQAVLGAVAEGGAPVEPSVSTIDASLSRNNLNRWFRFENAKVETTSDPTVFILSAAGSAEAPRMENIFGVEGLANLDDVNLEGFLAISNGIYRIYPTSFEINEPPVPPTPPTGEVVYSDYLFDVADDSALSPYTIIDANGDDVTWQVKFNYVNCFAPSKANAPGNDWLITPAISLEEGMAYEFSIEGYGAVGNTGNRLELWAGTAPTVEGMTDNIMEETILPYGWYPYSGRFIPEASGEYYFGVRCTSLADDSWIVGARKLTVTAVVSKNAPAIPADLVAVPEGSTHNVKVSFTVPSTTLGGDALASELTSVELYRGEELLNSFKAPEKGTTLTFDDVVPADGDYTYSVFAAMGELVGLPAVTTVFVGVNYPGVSGGVTVAETETLGSVHVSWQPVNTDIEGHQLDASQVTYTLYAKDMDYNLYEPIAEGLTATEFDHVSQPADAPQAFCQYAVAAVTARGEGEKAESLWLPVGPADVLPYAQSFTSEDGPYFWALQPIMGQRAVTGQCGWDLMTDGEVEGITSQDADGRCAWFEGNAIGDEATMFTGKIHIDGENPGLTFRYFSIAERNTNELHLYIDAGNGFEEKDMFVQNNGTMNWSKATVLLDEYAGKDIRLAFNMVAKAHQYGFIDNISISTVYDYDLKALAISAPAQVNAGENILVTTRVENAGRNAASDFTVDLYCNDELVDSKNGVVMQPDAVRDFAFTVKTNVTTPEALEYHVEISYPQDQCTSDNVSSVCAVELILPGYLTVNDLDGTVSTGSVALNWSAPNATDTPLYPFNETFEAYEPFGFANFGQWQFVDGDGAKLGGMEVEVPNLTAGVTTASFFLFDNTLNGLSGYSGFEAVSGNRYLLSMYGSQGETLDDWAISPKLSGVAQTVSLYARGYTLDYPETMEVLYSTSEDATSGFTSLETVAMVPETWTRYEYELPEGATYLAIRSCGQNNFMLFVDDVRFIPAHNLYDLPAPAGYNVYRDGVRINQEPVAETRYVDVTDTSVNHTYHVSVVYGVGQESRVSNEFCYNASGAGTANLCGAKVLGAEGCVIINNAEGREVTVADVMGHTFYSGVPDGRLRVAVPSGVILVRVDGTSFKVLAR